MRYFTYEDEALGYTYWFHESVENKIYNASTREERARLAIFILGPGETIVKSRFPLDKVFNMAMHQASENCTYVY